MSSFPKKRIDTTFRDTSITDSIKKKLKTEENQSSFSSDIEDNSQESSPSGPKSSKGPQSTHIFSM